MGGGGSARAPGGGRGRPAAGSAEPSSPSSSSGEDEEGGGMGVLGRGGVGLAELLAEREWEVPPSGGGGQPEVESLEQILAARQWDTEDFEAFRGRASSGGGSSSVSRDGSSTSSGQLGDLPVLAEEGSLSKLLAEREWGGAAAAGEPMGTDSPSYQGSASSSLAGEASLGRLLAEREWGSPGQDSPSDSPRQRGGEFPRNSAREKRTHPNRTVGVGRRSPRRSPSPGPGRGDSPGGSDSSGSFSLSPRGAAVPPPALEQEVSLGDILVHSEQILQRGPHRGRDGSSAGSSDAEGAQEFSVAEELRLINKGLELRIREAGHVWYGQSLVDSYRSPPGGAKKDRVLTSPSSILDSEFVECMGVRHKVGDTLSMVNVFTQRLGQQRRQAVSEALKQPKRKSSGKSRSRKKRREPTVASGAKKEAATITDVLLTRDAETEPPLDTPPHQESGQRDTNVDAVSVGEKRSPGRKSPRAAEPAEGENEAASSEDAGPDEQKAEEEQPHAAGNVLPSQSRCSPRVLQRRLQAALQHMDQLEVLEAGLKTLEAEYAPRDNAHNQKMLEYLDTLEQQRADKSQEQMASRLEALGEKVGNTIESSKTDQSAALAELRSEVLERIEISKTDVTLADIGAAAEAVRQHQDRGISRLREELFAEIGEVTSKAESKHEQDKSARESLRSETQNSLHRLREDILKQLKQLERQMHHGVVGARETAAVWIRSQENSLRDLRQELLHRLDAINIPTGVAGWPAAVETGPLQALGIGTQSQVGLVQTAGPHSDARPSQSPVPAQALTPPPAVRSGTSMAPEGSLSPFPALGDHPVAAQMPQALRKLEFQAGGTPTSVERPIRPEFSHASTIPEDYSQDFDDFMPEHSEGATIAERSLASVAEDSALEIPESPSYIPESPSSIPEEVPEAEMGLITEEASLRDVTEDIVGMESMASLDPLSPGIEASIPEVPSELSPVSVDLQPQPSTVSDAVAEDIDSPSVDVASEPSGRGDEDFEELNLGIMVVPSNMYKDTSSDSVPAATTSGEETRDEKDPVSDSEEKSEILSVISEKPTEVHSEHWQDELPAPELSPPLFPLEGELTSDPSRVGSETSYADAASEEIGGRGAEVLSEPSSEAGPPPFEMKEPRSDPSEDLGSDPSEAPSPPGAVSDEPSEIGTDTSHAEFHLESYKSEEFLPEQAVLHTLRPSPQAVDEVTEALLGDLLLEAVNFVFVRQGEVSRGEGRSEPNANFRAPPSIPLAPLPSRSLKPSKRQRALSTMDAPTDFYDRQVERVLASQDLCLDYQGAVDEGALENMSMAEAKQAAYSLDRLVHDLCQQALHQSATTAEVREESAMYPVLNPAPLMGRRLPPPALAQYVARQVKSWSGAGRAHPGRAHGGGAAAAALLGDAAEEEALWLRGCSTEEVYIDTAEAIVDDLLADVARSLLRLS